MGEVIYINNQNLSVKEFQNQRVVNFQDIDRVHNRPDGTAKRNFNSNSNRFIEGEDYYLICKDEFRTDLWENFGFSKFAAKGYLITETGYLMLVKSLQDDLAWEVQRKLIKNYFRAKEIVQQPKNEFDLMRRMIDQIESAKKEASEAKELAENIKDTIIQTDEDWRKWVNKQVNKIGYERGGEYQKVRRMSYAMLENRGHCRLEVRLNNLKERLREAGATETRINDANKLDVIGDDPRLREIYKSIIKEMSIKYSA
jgi:phage regulator Rha-like protein